MRRPHSDRRSSPDSVPQDAAAVHDPAAVRAMLGLPAEGAALPPDAEGDAVAALPLPQQAALEVLMSGRSARVAGEVAGVHERTVYRWVHEDPAFRAALAQFRDRFCASAHARLVALTD